VTTIRIAHAEPRPGKLADGGFDTRGYLVVLADDANHRAVPVWITEAGDLEHLLRRPVDQVITDDVPQELTARLLGAASARVTGVDIDVTEAGVTELSPEVTVARIGLAGPAGNRQVTADLGLGLALAVAAGTPVRVPDALLDRLAVPVSGDDLLTPFLGRVPLAAQPRPGYPPPRWPLAAPGRRPRFEPRNLDFAGGLDWWDLDYWPGSSPDRPGAADGEPDYAVTAEGVSGFLASAVPRPAGSAALVQSVYADDYRGTAVTFSGEVSTGQTGLYLEIVWPSGGEESPGRDHGRTVTGGHDWAGQEVSARIPDDADLMRFGIALNGPGRVALRNPGLRITGSGAGAP
jgi:hypothetical protein